MYPDRTVHTPNMKILKILQANKATKSLPTICNPPVCVKRIKGVSVLVREAYSVIFHLEPRNIGQASI